MIQLLISALVSSIVFISYDIYKNKLYKSFKEELENREKINKERLAKSLKRSKEVLLGQGAEQIAPYLKNFPYAPQDTRFLGAPIDLIVFNGSVKDNIDKIIFVEIKTGNSQLSKKQKQIRKIIEDGNVEWLEYRIDTDKIKIDHNEELSKLDECLCDNCILIVS